MANDIRKLQGTWHVTSLEIDGKETPPSALTGAKIVIDKEAFTSIGMGNTYGGRVELIPAKGPKAFDLVFDRGPEKGNRNRGIYKLADDTWTICLSTVGTARPRTFTTKPGSGFALEVLRRTPAGPEAPAPAKSRVRANEPAADSQAAGPPTEIDGEWDMTEAVLNGKPLAPDMVKWCRRITRGDLTTVLAGPQTMLKARFQLDPSARPRAIDYVVLEGADKGKAQAGIYELDGKTLRICMAAPGKSRPIDFSWATGDGRSFTAWRLGKR